MKAHTSDWKWWVDLGLRLFLAGLFLLSGFTKLRDLPFFLQSIETFQLVPFEVAYGIAFFLPWLEIFCALALIFKFLHRGAIGILTVAMGVFLGVYIVSWARGLDITCGCFGKEVNETNYPLAIVNRLFWLMLLLWLCWFHLVRGGRYDSERVSPGKSLESA